MAAEMVCPVDGCGVSYRRGEKEAQEKEDLKRHFLLLKNNQQKFMWDVLENPVSFQL